MAEASASAAPKPTAEQEEICGTELSPGQRMVVRAYAGSGKSSTLRFYARRRPDLPILYLCYNRELAQEAKNSFPENVECRTMHSLAYLTHGVQFNDRTGKLGNLRPRDVMERLGLTSPYMGVLVIEVLTNFLNSLDRVITEEHVPARAPNRGMMVDMAARAWRCMQDTGDPLPMPHDGYLKLWAIDEVVHREYSVIFVDEAQDLNPITSAYAQRMAESRAAGVIMVGDSHQSIYSFRLAVDAIEDAVRDADHVRSLTWCFRFGQEIADRASVVLNRLKDDPVHLVGAGRHQPGLGRVVLGRTNAGLIRKAADELIRKPGTKIHYAGTSERDRWSPEKPYRLQEIRDLYELFRLCPENVKTPYFRKFRGWSEVQEFVEEAGDIELGAIYRLVEEHREGIPALLGAVEKSAVGPAEAALSLSTAHRSKGREWDSAELLDDFKPVWSEKEQLAARKSESARRRFAEEVNLLYVAMTRPRMQLKVPRGLERWVDQQLPSLRKSD